MHLRAIKLRGFKSFPDPVEVRLEPGVAVVVGPNGSGKSNVSDAIVWAAGSLSPSELRAEKPDDVLYAGGNGREAASFAEVVFDCTAGGVSVEALRQAGEENLDGKVLIDLANPLDFSRGMPPRLTVCNDDSLGEQIQRAFPEVRVVKTLNTVNHLLMVDPALVPGEHHLFLCGNDAAAKSSVDGEANGSRSGKSTTGSPPSPGRISPSWRSASSSSRSTSSHR